MIPLNRSLDKDTFFWEIETDSSLQDMKIKFDTNDNKSFCNIEYGVMEDTSKLENAIRKNLKDTKLRGNITIKD